MPIVSPEPHIVATLNGIPRDVRRKLTPAMKKASEPIVRTAKSNSSWSRRIPGSIRTVVLKKGVAIRAGRKRAPHARPYEGVGTSGQFFRHPVFGNRDNWVAQRKRPFLLPAVQQHREEVRKAIEQVVDDAARRYGFR